MVTAVFLARTWWESEIPKSERAVGEGGAGPCPDPGCRHGGWVQCALPGPFPLCHSPQASPAPLK